MRDKEIQEEAKRLVMFIGFIPQTALEIEIEQAIETFYLQGIEDAKDSVGEWHRP